MRFSLQSMLLAFVVFWSSLAAFGLGGILVAALLIGGVAFLRGATSKRQTVERIVILLVIVLCLLCLLLPAVQVSREAPRRFQCMNNLKQIGLALLNYHHDHGCFPPAYIPDASGKPMHSWRVLLLPYLEQQALYDQYDFDEPWDGPNNSTLTATGPPNYFCPSDPNPYQMGATNYLAVVGPTAAWAGAKPRRLDDFADGPHATLLVVEVANSGINWMEPRDLSFDRARARVNRKSPGGISSPHVRPGRYFYHDYTGANVLCADGSIRFLTDDVPPAVLERLLTIDGGEAMDLNHIPGMAPDLNWTRIVGLVVLAISVALLLFRPKEKPPTTRP